MYHTKELGRNTYAYFTDAMNREVSRKLVLGEKMYGAADRGEFTIVYQPQLDVNIAWMILAQATHHSAICALTPLMYSRSIKALSVISRLIPQTRR